MPNDEVEMERLDMTHAMMVKAIKNRLFLAPLEKEKIQQILDVGTGTGICKARVLFLYSRRSLAGLTTLFAGAVEIGDIFENAEVIGVDLSAIQPSW